MFIYMYCIDIYYLHNVLVYDKMYAGERN